MATKTGTAIRRLARAGDGTLAKRDVEALVEALSELRDEIETVIDDAETYGGSEREDTADTRDALESSASDLLFSLRDQWGSVGGEE